MTGLQQCKADTLFCVRIRVHSSLHGRVKLILGFAKVGQKRVHDPTPFGIKLGTVVDLQQLSIHHASRPSM